MSCVILKCFIIKCNWILLLSHLLMFLRASLTFWRYTKQIVIIIIIIIIIIIMIWCVILCPHSRGMVQVGTGLVQMEWHPARWSVCLPLLLFHCTIKSRSSLLEPAHPGGHRKRAVKRCSRHPRVVHSARYPVRELAYPRVAQ